MYFLLILCFSSTPDCKFNCHKRCAAKVPRDCLGEVDFNGGECVQLSFTITLYRQHASPPGIVIVTYIWKKKSFKFNIILHTALYYCCICIFLSLSFCCKTNLEQEYGVFLFTSMQLQVFVHILYYVADT